MTRDRLREWGHFARDRKRFERAKSAEGGYRSPQRDHHEPIPGDTDAPHPDARKFNVLRALETEALIKQNFAPEPGPNVSYRALTAWYAMRIRPGYTGSPIWPILRALTRAAGYRVDQGGYAQIVFFAECKLAPQVYKTSDLAYIGASDLVRPSAESPTRNGRASLPLMNHAANASHKPLARPLEVQAIGRMGGFAGPRSRG